MKKKVIQYWDYYFIAIFFLVIHVFAHTNYWDDLVIKTYLPEHGFNLYELARYIYTSWSSRVFVIVIEGIIGYLPDYVWRITDVLVILLFYYCIKYFSLLNEKVESRNAIYPLLFCCYPFSLMATAGWMTTTIGYIWTLGIGCFCIVYTLRYLHNEIKIGKFGYIIFGGLAVFSSNMEIVGVVMLICFILEFFEATQQKKNRFIFFEGIIISAVNIILVFISPGNKCRLYKDAAFHDTEAFFSLSFLGKLRMAINSSFYHFTSVPNVVLFIFCFFIVVSVAQKCNNKMKRFISIIPLSIDLIWTVYFFVFYTLKNEELTYLYPDMTFKIYGKVEQYFASVSCIVLIIAIIYSLIVIADDSQISSRWILIFILGLIPETALGFTTTISASILRTVIFIYFSLIILTLQIFNRNIKYSNNIFEKRIRPLMYGFCIIGVICNCAQLFRHLLIYG